MSPSKEVICWPAKVTSYEPSKATTSSQNNDVRSHSDHIILCHIGREMYIIY